MPSSTLGMGISNQKSLLLCRKYESNSATISVACAELPLADSSLVRLHIKGAWNKSVVQRCNQAVLSFSANQSFCIV